MEAINTVVQGQRDSITPSKDNTPKTPPKGKGTISKKSNLDTIEENQSSSLIKNPFKRETEKGTPSSDPSNPFPGDAEQPNSEKQHPPMTWRRFMAIFSLGCLLCAAQIPLYLLGGSLAYMVDEIGGQNAEAWVAIAYNIALAAIAPFAGAMSDLMGRRYAALLGALLVVIGMIIVGTAWRIEVVIGGMAISGVGAGLAEVIGTAGVAELAPVESRGKYVGLVFILILPFAGSAGYAQLYSASATWRWGAWINIILNGGTFGMLFLFYWPPPRENSKALTKWEIFSRIDYIGAILSVGGFALFLLGIQWGGYTYPWRSAHVIATMTVGLAMIVLFVVWENIVKYPMVPKYRVSILTLIVTGVAGANFYSLLNFWPLECQVFFNHTPHAIARTVIAFGFATASGVIIVDILLSVLHGANRELLAISSALMTAGVGGMAAVNQHRRAAGIGLSVLGGLGIGGIIIPAAVILTIISPDEYIATITAINLSVRFIGGSIGYAIYWNVFENKLADVIPTIVGTAAVAAGLPLAQLVPLLEDIAAQNTSALATIPGITPSILLAVEGAVQDAYAQGFKKVYLVSIAFGGAAVLAAVFLGDIRKYMVSRVAVDIH